MRMAPGRMLLAEANQWPEDTQLYFGDGDECHMAFHFPLMPRMYMAMAQEDRFPITDIMRQTPDIPENCQWAIFLRNHDELTLEMVTDKERDYLWETYASDKRARINLGIRRRLAPLLEHDRRRIELMNSLLLSMPGTPVIYYGDEIGMGDNIHLGDRDGVRTPMQWSPDRNGGFSRADPASLVLPAIMDPLYGYEAVNVEAQAADQHSLLNWTRRMLAVRRGTSPSGAAPSASSIPATARSSPICASTRARPSSASQPVAHRAGGGAGPRRVRRPRAGGADRRLLLPADRPADLPADPAALRLLLVPLATEAAMPSWHTPAPEPMSELSTSCSARPVEGAARPRCKTWREASCRPTCRAPLVRRQGAEVTQRASPSWRP
jgi:maltose alpha-D-glucosyltransferase/alpha-amylase